MPEAPIQLRSDRRGAVTLIVALALPVIVGVLGLGTEVGYWYALRAEMQRAVDLTVHAGAVEYADSGDQQSAVEAAYSAAMLNGIDSSDLSVSFLDTEEGLAISASASRTASRYFSQLTHGGSFIDINTQSVGLVRPERMICVLALGSGGDGIEISGSALLDATGCSIHSNAADDDAVGASGTALIHADCISMVGTDDVLSSHISLDECAGLETEMQEVLDPYLDIEPPSLAVPPYNSIQTSRWESTIGSGRYAAVDLKGEVEIETGATIVVDGGHFKTFGTVDLVGRDVTIFFINGATLEMGSNTELNLSAKVDGAYAGLLFVGDRTSTVEAHTLQGGTASELTGAIYLPTGSLQMVGGSQSTMGCTHIVAHQISIRGQSLARNNCDSAGVRDIRLNKMAGFGFIN